MARISCFHCHKSWELETPIPRSEECPHCHSDAKVCLNCKFYDRSAYRECREPQASWVKEKDRANFCSYFSPAEGGPASSDNKDDTKRKLEDLFKK